MLQKYFTVTRSRSAFRLVLFVRESVKIKF